MCGLVNRMESSRHLLVEPLIDLVGLPVKVVGVLDLLKVGDGHAAGVAQKVGNDIDPILVQDFVAGRGGGTVGQFGHDLGRDLVRVPLTDLVLQGGRDKDVDIELQEILVADRPGILTTAVGTDRALLFLPLHRLVKVQAVFGIDSSAGVGDGHHFGTKHLGHKLVGELTRIAIALNGDRGLGQVNAQDFGRFADGEHATPSRRITAARRAPQRDRLASDNARHVVAAHHGVFVHHPGHNLWRGVDVGRWNISLLADIVADGPNIGAAQSFELAHRQFLGVADDAALASPQGNVDHSRLPGHPGCQSADGVDGLVRVVAETTLRRATRVVVLHPKTFEHLRGTIIHTNGQCDVKLPARPT